jgi:GTP cyclohydrolase I
MKGYLRAVEAVRDLLRHAIGEDPSREGLQETPARVAKAWEHWAKGYSVENPSSLLKTFADGAEYVTTDEIVLVANIPVYSMCEHHLAPFWGVAHVGYIPNQRIVGLSKFNRLVDAYARRLQVQERLTAQIAVAVAEALEPVGVGVVLECRHMCIESRGVQHRGTVTTTSKLYGAMREDHATRAEFFSLTRSASLASKGL